MIRMDNLSPQQNEWISRAAEDRTYCLDCDKFHARGDKQHKTDRSMQVIIGELR